MIWCWDDEWQISGVFGDGHARLWRIASGISTSPSQMRLSSFDGVASELLSGNKLSLMVEFGVR